MKIMDHSGAGGPFSEYYLADLHDDVMYLGDDWPAHHCAIGTGHIAGKIEKPARLLNVQH